MEDELFASLYQHLRAVAKPRRKRQTYSDLTVLLVYFWAVLHDRPTNWACQQRHWPPEQRIWPKPSPSRMSRRLRQVHLQELMSELEERLRPKVQPPLVKTIDAKPLPVGGFSKDKQATWGQAAKVKAKGYKLFALCDSGGILAWEVQSLHVPETTVARRLIPSLDGGGYLLGDALYDSNSLHDLAGVCSHHLLAPRKKPGTGLGNRPHSVLRLRAIAMLEPPKMPNVQPSPFAGLGPELYKQRTSIERVFGHMGNFACGLKPLPNWVRTLRRVRQWVHAKIIINALRLRALEKQRLAA